MQKTRSNNKMKQKIIFIVVALALIVSLIGVYALESDLTATVRILGEFIFIRSPVEGNIYTSKQVLLDVEVIEQVRRLYYQLNDNGWIRICSNCDSYKDYIEAEEGFNELEIAAQKYNGDYELESVDFYISLPPFIKINNPENITYYSSEVLLDVELREEARILEYSLNGNDWIRLCRRCDSYSGNIKIEDGSNHLIVRARTYEGGYEYEDVHFHAELPPFIIINNPVSNETYNGIQVLLDVELREEARRLYYQLNDNGWIRICSNCQSYSGYIEIEKDGENELDIAAQKDNGDYEFEEVSFFANLPPFIIINNPENTTYNKTNLVLDVETAEKVRKLYSRLNNGNWNELCRNCDDYNGIISVSEGSNYLEIAAQKSWFNYEYEDVYFHAESPQQNETNQTDITPPIIHNTYPSRLSFGLFGVQYTEENLEQIKLYYGPNLENEAVFTGCGSGNEIWCYNDVDLSMYGFFQRIYYQFEVRDGNHVTYSDKVRIRVF